MDEQFLEKMGHQLAGWEDPAKRLRTALEKDELALYCQPIRALTGTVTYPLAEVLVRLREEESALLPPGEFLPVFEHYQMMPQLDRWVVRNTVRRLAKGSKVPRFSVNLSGQTLADPDFPAHAAAELMNAGVPASSLLFEIDETDALNRTPVVARFCAAVKSIGIGVMLDGFGRRAASFAALKDLRADFIKVDGSVVRRILTSDTAANKLRAIVRVGEALHIGVVAECVEEQDILVRLKALGVGFVQGFGVYRPHAIDSIAG